MATTVIHTDDLIMANREAVHRRYNRTLSSKMIDALDPDGINIVTYALAQDDFIRLLLLLKLTGRDEPVQGWFDMSYDRYNALPRLERTETGELVRVEPTA